MGKVELISRTLCEAAAKANRNDCPMCQESGGVCSMWKTFRNEARAVLAALKYNGIQTNEMDT